MSHRSQGVQMLLVAGLAGVGWALLVQPIRKDLAAREAAATARGAEIDAGEAEVRALGEATARRLEELNRRAENWKTLWQRSGDASGLYEALQAAASDAGLTIERIEPRRGSGRATVSGAEVSSVGYTLEISGPYPAVAAFLRTVETEMGMSRVESFRVASMRDSARPEVLRATVATSHFAAPDLLKPGSSVASARGGKR